MLHKLNHEIWGIVFSRENCTFFCHAKSISTQFEFDKMQIPLEYGRMAKRIIPLIKFV